MYRKAEINGLNAMLYLVGFKIPDLLMPNNKKLHRC